MRHRIAVHPTAAAAANTLVVLAMVTAACAAPGTSSLPSAAASSPTPTATPAISPSPPRPLIVDTDLSSDDLLALAYLLGTSAPDLQAITVSGTGVGRCPPGASNAAALAAELGVGVPTACGSSETVGDGHAVPDAWRGAADRAYGLTLGATAAPAPATAKSDATAVGLMARVLTAAHEPVDVLALGPMTNLAQLIAAHPDLVARIGRVVMMGGALAANGNVGGTVSPGSPEWNIWSDPVAAAAVFASGLPIVMVPLDATSAVPLTSATLAELARDHRAGGADLAYELLVRNPYLVGEGQFLWDPLAAVVLGYPSVATLVETRVRIGTAGAELGRTIEDSAGTTVSVARSADARQFGERFFGGLRSSPARTTPFATAGAVAITYDGARCLLDAPPAAPGLYSVAFSDTAKSGAAALVVTVHAGHSWQEVVDFAASVERQTGNPDFVDLAVVPPAYGGVPAIVAIPAGTSGIACVTADANGKTTSAILSAPFTLGGS